MGAEFPLSTAPAADPASGHDGECAGGSLSLRGHAIDQESEGVNKTV